MEQFLAHLTTAGYIALCVLLFSLAIFIHEFGHFIVALLLGLRVERFSIGFGPAIWKRVWRGVEYRIAWIPLGGYVMIPDIDPEGTKKLEGGDAKEGEAPKDKAEEVPREPIAPWKELLVSVAGPAMNIVLAVVLAIILSVVPGARFGETPAVIHNVVPTLMIDGKEVPGPAAAAGLRLCDEVIAIGGHPVRTWSQLQTEIQICGERETEFTILRHGTNSVRTVTKEMSVKVKAVQDPISGMYLIGALSVPCPNGAVSWMPDRSPIRQLMWDAGSIFRVLKALMTPKDAKTTSQQLGGPVMIAEGVYRSLRRDIWDGIGFLRFLNVNLAVLNLLPIPVLDGGLILFALIALVFRRRVPAKIVNALSVFFMVVLLSLMLLLMGRDTLRSWRIHHANDDPHAVRNVTVTNSPAAHVQTNANPTASNR